MDARQITYIVAIMAITLLARGQWRILAVMWVNLAVTLATVLAADLGYVTPQQAAIRGAVGDLMCATLLLMLQGGVARVVMYLYLPMPVCVIASIVMGYGTYGAYTFAYVLGYIQLAVVWVGNGTFGRGGRGSGGGGGGGIRGVFRGSADRGYVRHSDFVARSGVGMAQGGGDMRE
jgi:hypothetical protein